MWKKKELIFRNFNSVKKCHHCEINGHFAIKKAEIVRIAHLSRRTEPVKEMERRWGLPKKRKILESSSEDTKDGSATVTTAIVLLRVAERRRKQKCLFDSGATSQFCSSGDAFETFRAELGRMKAGNRKRARSHVSSHTGVSKCVDFIAYIVSLAKSTFATDMMFNLISTSRARKAGYKITSDNGSRDRSKGVTPIVRKQSKKAAFV